MLFHFEYLSVPNMARAQLLRWLRRDAERVPHPPDSQAPPRSAAIRQEVYLPLQVLGPPYLDTDINASDAQTCRETFMMRVLWFIKVPDEL